MGRQRREREHGVLERRERGWRGKRRKEGEREALMALSISVWVYVGIGLGRLAEDGKAGRGRTYRVPKPW